MPQPGSNDSVVCYFNFFVKAFTFCLKANENVAVLLKIVFWGCAVIDWVWLLRILHRFNNRDLVAGKVALYTDPFLCDTLFQYDIISHCQSLFLVV